MLSSASLFHFTHDFETLKKIIGGGFKPFYSSEDLTMFGVPECPGIPMVCFCDIPLSHAKRHMRDYGRYAIGLNKTWGKAKNISPVHYIYEGSICARVIKDAYDALPKDTDTFDIDCTCMKFNTRTALFFYGKPYRGRLRKAESAAGEIEDKGEVTFYDEREWRYVPFADETRDMEEIPTGVRSMLSTKELATSEIRTNASTLLHKRYTLTFGAEDVRYLIVDNESEIPELVDFVYGLREGGENSELRMCSDNERKRLTTRVISMQQIEQDF